MSVALEQMTSTTEMWGDRSWEGRVDRRRCGFAQAQVLRKRVRRRDSRLEGGSGYVVGWSFQSSSDGNDHDHQT
jgi:hypothetical protein